MTAVTIAVDDPFFGGISGLARGPGGWMLLSDDKSERSAARVYPAAISFRRGQVVVAVSSPRKLRDRAGLAFAKGTVDPEAIRYGPRARRWLWASEGSNSLAPSVRVMDQRGRQRLELPLPASFVPSEHPRSGPRANASIEGIAFAPSGALWVALEAPLLQDGPPPTRTTGALVRLTRIGRAGDLQQYAYPLDAVPWPGTLPSDNGVSEILALDENRLLVLERSGMMVATGKYRFRCRLYLADLRGADDTHDAAILSSSVRTSSKTLVFDFGSLPGSERLNLEGMAWAPRGGDPQGRLLLVNDDNFDRDQPTTLVVMNVFKD